MEGNVSQKRGDGPVLAMGPPGIQSVQEPPAELLQDHGCAPWGGHVPSEAAAPRNAAVRDGRVARGRWATLSAELLTVQSPGDSATVKREARAPSGCSLLGTVCCVIIVTSRI